MIPRFERSALDILGTRKAPLVRFRDIIPVGKMRCNNLPLFRRLGTLLKTVLVLTAFFSAPELLALANLNGKDYIFSA